MLKLSYLIFTAIMLSVPAVSIAADSGALQGQQNSESGTGTMNQETENQATEDQDMRPDLMQKIRDASITASIKTKMMFDGDVDALNINVDTVNQVVTLSGTVENPEQVTLAQQMAEQTSGVVAVYNQIEVKTASKSS